MKAFLTSPITSVITFVVIVLLTPTPFHLITKTGPMIIIAAIHPDDDKMAGTSLLPHSSARFPIMEGNFNPHEEKESERYAIMGAGGGATRQPAKKSRSRRQLQDHDIVSRNSFAAINNPPNRHFLLERSRSVGRGDHFLAPHVLPQLQQNASMLVGAVGGNDFNSFQNSILPSSMTRNIIWKIKRDVAWAQPQVLFRLLKDRNRTHVTNKPAELNGNNSGLSGKSSSQRNKSIMANTNNVTSSTAKSSAHFDSPQWTTNKGNTSSGQNNLYITNGKQSQLIEKEDYPTRRDLRSTSDRLTEELLTTIPYKGADVVSSVIRKDPLVQNDKAMIHCACDTLDCTSNQQLTCTTPGSCYTQILERPHEKGPSVIRGCINDPTPLLCENRRPKIVALWPTFKCCRTHMCNDNMQESTNTSGTFNASSKSTTGNILKSNAPAGPESRNGSTRAIESEAWLGRLNATGDSIRLDSLGKFIYAYRTHNSDSTTGITNRRLGDLAVPNQVNRTSKVNENHESNLKGETKDSSLYHGLPEVSFLAMIFLIGGATLVVIISGISYFILKREKSQTPRNSYNEAATSDPEEMLEGKLDSTSLQGMEDSVRSSIPPAVLPSDSNTTTSPTLNANLIFYHTQNSRLSFPHESAYPSETIVIYDDND